MKKIYFMRHAKTERLAASDFERVLTERGVSDCALMAGVLKSYKVATEMIYSSSAARAMQTANIIAEHLGAKVIGVDELYEASARGILEFIACLKENLDSVLIVGHNPAMWEIYDILGGKNIDGLPTAAVFCAETDYFANIFSAKVEWLETAKKHR